MKALVLRGPFDIRVENVPMPQAEDDEVLIEVKACAVCGSDIHGYDGSSTRRVPPVIMGHEASGRIAQCGKNVTGWNVGDWVTFDSTEYCGKCWYCRHGAYNLCVNRKIVGVSCGEYKKQGAMAEYIAVKAHMLYEIPETVSYREACLCEPLSVGMHAVGISPLERDGTALVVGAGTIGLTTLMAAKSRTEGAVFSWARYDGQRERAREMGAVSPHDPGELWRQISEATDGRGVDVVYDTVGTQESFRMSFDAVRPGGAVVCVGNNRPVVEFPLQECVVKQIAVLGSYSSSGEFALCLEQIASGKIDLKPFMGNLYRVEQGPELFRRLAQKGNPVLKAIIEF